MESDIEANTWWTNLGLTDREVIGLYHAHGECEQFHSEIKTDVDLERLPSGKFETRQLLIGLGRSNPWRYAFAEVYTAFADFRA